MLDAFLQGLLAVFQPVVLLAIVGGVLLGLIIGIIPVIGALTAVGMLIPFVFRLPPEIGLGFLVALASVTITGGSITAILLGIPGTAGNVATTFDGYPMTCKGQGSEAIGAALASSMFGGVGAVFMALLMIPVVVPLVLAFRTPEMTLLVALGLVCMATLVGRSVGKGIISGFLGVILALIRIHPSTGTHRFTFGIVYLFDGISLIAVVLGIWGIAALLDLMLREQSTISESMMTTKLSRILRGAKEVWHHKWLWFRSTVIGYVIGVVPGVGTPQAAFITYAQAKLGSKNRDKFGTGCVEGVIGPESANNASSAGDLLTTMAFGIPGSAVMAVLMGAFFMVGVTPGPSMVKENLPLAFTLLIGIALANVVAAVICFGATPYLARIARVSKTVLFPLILVVILAGAFAERASMFSVLVVMSMGLLGFLMIRFGYSRPALTLGFVLGRLFEEYFYRALKLHGPLFFLTPISLVLIALIVLLLTQPYLKGLPRRLLSRRS